jgi:hypothetical protein
MNEQHLALFIIHNIYKSFQSIWGTGSVVFQVEGGGMGGGGGHTTFLQD